MPVATLCVAGREASLLVARKKTIFNIKSAGPSEGVGYAKGADAHRTRLYTFLFFQFDFEIKLLIFKAFTPEKSEISTLNPSSIFATFIMI